MRCFLSLVAAMALAVTGLAEPKISWKKTVLDTKFRSEGVAIADVNKDGRIDVLNGEYWYEAPDWKPHEMQPFKDHSTGMGNYSRVFAAWADDYNGDGYPDLLVIDFPGAPCYWMENPKGKEGHWTRHEIWHSACNETPLYVDLFKTGKRVLVMGFQPKGAKTDGNEGQMAWFTPGKDPNGLWDMHPISEPTEKGKPGIPGTMRFSHGLGVGDVNGDGRNDVITTGGWWAQPEKDDGKPWPFHAANLGEAAADMFAMDFNGDGKADILSTSAHRFGIWLHEQRSPDAFTKKDLFRELVSETHAMHHIDIDGDGLKDFVTGKRWWSHGRSEPGSDWNAMIYWFKTSKSKDGTVKLTPIVIDTDSGIGTQFAVEDINGDGLFDVIVSNKKGVFVIEQVRTPAETPKAAPKAQSKAEPARGEQPKGGKYWVFVGTYTGGKGGSKGIYRAEFDSETGTLGEPEVAAEITSPSFLAVHPNGSHLFCVCEINELKGKKGGGVGSFTLDAKTGKLTPVNLASTIGTGPCHINCDATGKFVLIANYGGGSTTVVPVGENGTLGDATDFVQHKGSSVNKSRQEAPHAHSVNLDGSNTFAVVADLGLDKLLVYKFDAATGKIVPNDPAAFDLEPGAGPRHFAFHPLLPYAFTNNELDSTVTAMRFDRAKGTFSKLNTVTTLPEPTKGNSTAETVVHPNGKFVYVSNRGHNSIAVFEIEQGSGEVRAKGHQGEGIKVPRAFNIDPTGKWMIVANQDGHDIVVFKIDTETGKLTPTGQKGKVGSPVCVKFVAKP
jgi:6-phosphogluconolactonase (cycloisomerase 2 family)